MRACEEYIEKISRYLDEDLTAEEAEELFEHLSRCPNCAEALSSFEELRMMAEEHLPSVPPVLREGVMASVRAAKKKPLFARYRFTAVAAVFALVVLGISATPLGELLNPKPGVTQPLPTPAVSEPAPEQPANLARIVPSEPEIANDASTPELAETPAPEAEVTEKSLPMPELSAQLLLPETPYERAFSSYLAFSAKDAPEVLYDFVSDQTIDRTVYYIVPNDAIGTIQDALLAQDLEITVTAGDVTSTEALVILTLLHE